MSGGEWARLWQQHCALRLIDIDQCGNQDLYISSGIRRVIPGASSGGAPEPPRWDACETALELAAALRRKKQGSGRLATLHRS